jgi:hypothetical protein
MKSKSKNKPAKPTIEDFLSFIPKRAGYEWNVDEEGIVHISVPKFQGKWGKRLCKVLRKKETFTADMDELGSIVWTHCDGKNTVEDILAVLKEKYGDEKDLDQRLIVFLHQMRNLNYLYY